MSWKEALTNKAFLVNLFGQTNTNPVRTIDKSEAIVSNHLNGFWQHTKDELIIRFIREAQFQPNELDRQAADEALKLIDRVYQYKKCHLATCAVTASGTLVSYRYLFSSFNGFFRKNLLC